MSSVLDREMVLDSKEDVEPAKAAQRCIASALDHSRAICIVLLQHGIERVGDDPLLRLPPKVLRLFADVLCSLAQGKSVAIMPKEFDVTSQEAVSRPYLVRLFTEGKIAYHKVGTHRRIGCADVLQYKEDSQDALRCARRSSSGVKHGY